jgi:hypothetical protein
MRSPRAFDRDVLLSGISVTSYSQIFIWDNGQHAEGKIGTNVTMQSDDVSFLRRGDCAV